VIQLLIRCFLPSFCVPALSFEQAHRQPNDTVRDDAARRPEGVRPRHEDPFGDTDTLLNPQASRRDVIGGNNTPHLQEPRHDGGTGGDTLPTPQASRRYVTLGDLPNLLASHRNDTGGDNLPQDLPLGCVPCFIASTNDSVVDCCPVHGTPNKAAT